jgi:hypothetical protein
MPDLSYQNQLGGYQDLSDLSHATVPSTLAHGLYSYDVMQAGFLFACGGNPQTEWHLATNGEEDDENEKP